MQETDARRPDIGVTAHVFNIIAVKAGAEKNGARARLPLRLVARRAWGGRRRARRGGIARSGAACWRRAAIAATRSWSCVTDGEEAGLMGAAGLVTDRDVMDRLQAYINVEATGNGGGAMLFETGPGNGWIVKPWARPAPHPRGASYAIEIYRRLPNDTDFSIFKRHDVPGPELRRDRRQLRRTTPRATRPNG